MVKVKTISTQYLIKINNDTVSNGFDSLREARQYLKSMVLDDDINLVSIVRQNLNETVLDTYETKVTRVLTATQLDDGLE